MATDLKVTESKLTADQYDSADLRQAQNVQVPREFLCGMHAMLLAAYFIMVA